MEQLRQRFKLLSPEDIDNMPDPGWLIDGLLPANALSLVSGWRASYKSFLVVDWAFSVAAGEAWKGHAVEQGPVVYVASEGAEGYRKRKLGWESYNGISLVGKPFYMIAEPVNLFHPDDVAEFLNKLQPLENSPRLVVIDTLAWCMNGADENSNGDMTQIVTSADRIRRETGATLLLVHHTPRSGRNPRGASALESAVAMSALVESSKSGIVTITCDRGKEDKEFEPLTLRTHEVTLPDGKTSLVLVDGHIQPVISAQAESSAAATRQQRRIQRTGTRTQAALKIVKSAGSQGIRAEAVAEKLGDRRSLAAIRKQLERARQQGLVVQPQRGWYALPAA